MAKTGRSPDSTSMPFPSPLGFPFSLHANTQRDTRKTPFSQLFVKTEAAEMRERRRERCTKTDEEAKGYRRERGMAESTL